MDLNGTGAVPSDALRRAFDAAGHPDVVAGVYDARSCRANLARMLPPDDRGFITNARWEAYQRQVSACVGSDSSYEALLRGPWRVPSAQTPRGDGHGDVVAWTQAPSASEKAPRAARRGQSRAEATAWHHARDFGRATPGEAAREMDAVFGVKRSSTRPASKSPYLGVTKAVWANFCSVGLRASPSFQRQRSEHERASS